MNATAISTGARAKFLTGPIISGAVRDSFVKLDPRVQFRNPGHVRGVRGQHPHHDHRHRRGVRRRERCGASGIRAARVRLAVVDRAIRQLRGSRRRRARQGAGGDAARNAQACACEANPRQGSPRTSDSRGERAQERRPGAGRGQRHDSRRRRSRRRRGLGQRKCGHGRIRAGAARGGRRLLLGDRRHARVVRLAGGARHQPRRRGLSRSHDRDGGRRFARPYAQRDRARHPVSHDDAGIPAGHGDSGAVLSIRRRRAREPARWSPSPYSWRCWCA